MRSKNIIEIKLRDENVLDSSGGCENYTKEGIDLKDEIDWISLHTITLLKNANKSISDISTINIKIYILNDNQLPKL